MSKDSNRKYVTISMIAIIAALIGTLAISQVLQPLHAQNTSGQMGQKLGNVSGAAPIRLVISHQIRWRKLAKH